jgi:hypothetical protein
MQCLGLFASGIAVYLYFTPISKITPNSQRPSRTFSHKDFQNPSNIRQGSHNALHETLLTTESGLRLDGTTTLSSNVKHRNMKILFAQPRVTKCWHSHIPKARLHSHQQQTIRYQLFEHRQGIDIRVQDF